MTFKKKITELELVLARIHAMMISNKRLLTTTYNEYHISKISLDSESKEREKLNIESELYELRQKLTKLG